MNTYTYPARFFVTSSFSVRQHFDDFTLALAHANHWHRQGAEIAGVFECEGSQATRVICLWSN